MGTEPACKTVQGLVRADKMGKGPVQACKKVRACKKGKGKVCKKVRASGSSGPACTWARGLCMQGLLVCRMALGPCRRASVRACDTEGKESGPVSDNWALVCMWAGAGCRKAKAVVEVEDGDGQPRPERPGQSG